MEWSKIKTVLIILFAAVNLTAVGVLWGGEHAKLSIPQRLMDDALIVLSENGVEADAKVIGWRRYRARGYYVPAAAPEGEVAALLLSSGFEKEGGNDGGGVYYSDGISTFGLRNMAGVEFSGLFKGTGKNPKERATAFIKRISPEGSGYSLLAERDNSDGTVSLTFSQTYRGVTLDDMSLVVTAGEEGVLSASGGWLCFSPSPYEHTRIADPLNALLKFTRGNNKSGTEISEISLVLLSSRREGAYILFPAFKIISDGEKTSYYDAFTGEFIK